MKHVSTMGLVYVKNLTAGGLSIVAKKKTFKKHLKNIKKGQCLLIIQIRTVTKQIFKKSPHTLSSSTLQIRIHCKT
jgi:hypothetical protein